MKYLLPILLGLTLVSVSCRNKQTNQILYSTETSSNADREKDDKSFRRQTFELFIDVGDSIIDSGEIRFLQMLEMFGKEYECGDRWYKENVAHIDSVSRCCIELSDNGKDGELLKILTSELRNFQCHPIATADVCFDLNLILTKLYFDHADKYPDYLQKCIDLWELNRAQINVVQAGWQEYHPRYIDVLKILLQLYKSADNPQKVTEMQGLINEVTSSS